MKRALTRSEMMARIKGRDTQPELAIRSLLHSGGWRFRVHYMTPGGRVDIAFPTLRVAILIDGCFWHGCRWHGAKPKSNKEFWSKKLSENRRRDRRQRRKLGRLGWTVLRIWEHSVERIPTEVFGDLDKVLKRKMRSHRARGVS